jgi:hypothetical protein
MLSLVRSCEMHTSRCLLLGHVKCIITFHLFFMNCVISLIILSLHYVGITLLNHMLGHIRFGYHDVVHILEI